MLEHQSIAGARNENGLVAVDSEPEREPERRRLPAAKVQDGICSTLATNVKLQPLVGEIRKQAEQAEKIRLAGSIGADEDVDRAQLNLRRPNRLVALHADGIEGRHLDLRLSWKTTAVASLQQAK